MAETPPVLRLALFAVNLRLGDMPPPVIERALDEAAASEKFRASAILAFTRDKADRVREAVLALDTLSARELGTPLRG